MPEVLSQFGTLDEPVMSPSRVWSLCYDADGRAVIRDVDGTTTWAAGEVGRLRLEMAGVSVVNDGGAVVWRRDVLPARCDSLRVTDDGDAMIYGEYVPVFSLLHGRVDVVWLGDRAAVPQIRGNRVLRSDNGKRTVSRMPGDALMYRVGSVGMCPILPAETRTLEQPDTWLTWRFLEAGRHSRWALVLVDADDDIRWVHGGEPVAPQPKEPVAADPHDEEIEPDDYSPSWMDTGLGMEDVYCVTLIRDVAPDEALRRFGADDSQISTATWTQLLRRAEFEDSDTHDQVVAAFALGPHTLLVEERGNEGVHRPDLSRGTFAVSAYCSINADMTFLVSRDGETLATFDEGNPVDPEGTDPGVLTEALAEMDLDDPDVWEDEDFFLDDLELLCRIGGIRPTVTDVTGLARTIFVRATGR